MSTNGSIIASSAYGDHSIVAEPVQAYAPLEFVDSSGNASTEATHYERQASMPISGTGPYVNPLGRLNARRPIASFGFGGQLVTMILRQVQRFSDYGSGDALKIAPGMLSMQPLSSIIPQKHNAVSFPAAGLMPLLTGDTSRAALAKRRYAAISCAKTLLSDSAIAEELGAEEQALYRGTGAAAFGAMNDFRLSVAAPPMPSTDPSRTGTPMSTPDISALGEMPPVSAGSRAGAAKRRGARSRYVDVLKEQQFSLHYF
ncbi:hypothetical protein GGH96_006287 [Coemansia sp. RSA 1972]|nr:hypothetical protein GGH96_006287 [Coemansia sp. RSA 1972]